MPQATDKTDNKKIVSQWTTQETVDVNHEVGGIYLYQLVEIMPQENTGDFTSVCQYQNKHAKNPIDYALDLGDPQKSRSYHLRISSSIDSKKDTSYPYGPGEHRLSDVQAKKKLLDLIIENIAKRVASEKEDEDLQNSITNLIDNIVLPQLAQFRIDIEAQLNEFAEKKIPVVSDALRINYDPSSEKLSFEFVVHSNNITSHDLTATMTLTADLTTLPSCAMMVKRSVECSSAELQKRFGEQFKHLVVTSQFDKDLFRKSISSLSLAQLEIIKQNRADLVENVLFWMKKDFKGLCQALVLNPNSQIFTEVLNLVPVNERLLVAEEIIKQLAWLKELAESNPQLVETLFHYAREWPEWHGIAFYVAQQLPNAKHFNWLLNHPLFTKEHLFELLPRLGNAEYEVLVTLIEEHHDIAVASSLLDKLEINPALNVNAVLAVRLRQVVLKGNDTKFSASTSLSIASTAQQFTVNAQDLLNQSNINIALSWYRQYSVGTKQDAFALPGGDSEQQLYLDWIRDVKIQEMPRPYSVFNQRLYFAQKLAELIPDVQKRQRFEQAYSQDIGNLVSQLMTGFYSTNRLHMFSWKDSTTISVLTIQEQGNSIAYHVVVQPVMVMPSNDEKIFLPKVEFRWKYDDKHGQFILDTITSTHSDMLKLITHNLMPLEMSLLDDERNSKDLKQVVENFNHLLSLQLSLLRYFLTISNDDVNQENLLDIVVEGSNHKIHGSYFSMPNTKRDLTKQQKQERIISKEEAIKLEITYLKQQIKYFSTKPRKVAVSGEAVENYSRLMYGVLNIANAKGMSSKNQKALAHILKVIFQRFPANAENYLNKLSTLIASNDCPTKGKNLEELLRILQMVMVDANAKSVNTLFDLVKITVTSSAILAQRAYRDDKRSEALLQALTYALTILQKAGSNRTQQNEFQALFKACLDEIVAETTMSAQYQQVLAKLSQLAQGANICIVRSSNQKGVLAWLETSLVASYSPTSTATNTPTESLSISPSNNSDRNSVVISGSESPKLSVTSPVQIQTSLAVRPVRRLRASSAPVFLSRLAAYTPDSSTPGSQTPLSNPSSDIKDSSSQTLLTKVSTQLDLMETESSSVGLRSDASKENTDLASDASDLSNDMVTITIPGYLLDINEHGDGAFARDTLSQEKPVAVKYHALNKQEQQQEISLNFFLAEQYQQQLDQIPANPQYHSVASKILIDALVNAMYPVAQGQQPPNHLVDTLKNLLGDDILLSVGSDTDNCGLEEIIGSDSIVKFTPESYLFSPVADNNSLQLSIPGNIAYQVFGESNTASKQQHSIGSYETTVTFTRVASGYEIDIQHQLSFQRNIVELSSRLKNWLANPVSNQATLGASKSIYTDSGELEYIGTVNTATFMKKMKDVLTNKDHQAKNAASLSIAPVENNSKLYTVSYGQMSTNLSLPEAAAIAEVKMHCSKQPSLWQRILTSLIGNWKWFRQSEWVKDVQNYKQDTMQTSELDAYFSKQINDGLKTAKDNPTQFEKQKADLLSLVNSRKAVYASLGLESCPGFKTCNNLLVQASKITQLVVVSPASVGSSNSRLMRQTGIGPAKSQATKPNTRLSPDSDVQLKSISSGGYIVADDALAAQGQSEQSKAETLVPTATYKK